MKVKGRNRREKAQPALTVNGVGGKESVCWRDDWSQRGLCVKQLKTYHC